MDSQVDKLKKLGETLSDSSPAAEKIGKLREQVEPSRAHYGTAPLPEVFVAKMNAGPVDPQTEAARRSPDYFFKGSGPHPHAAPDEETRTDAAATPTSRPQPEPPPGMVTVGLNSDGTHRYGPAEPEKGAPSATEVVKRVTGQRGVRMGGVWRNLPEDLRPERLAGGLIVYPHNRADYEARLSQAVQDGAVSPNVAKQVMAGYDKWKRTPWGAMVDYSRLVREDKHIEMESARDRDLISEERNREESNLYRNLEKDHAEAQAAYEEERATYQREMDRLMSTQKRAIDALSRKEIDPNRWWNSQSNFGKVMSALGVTLGAAGSGLSAAYGRSTPNVAYDIMKSAINRDVQSQMADMRNKRSSVGARQSLLGTIMTQVKDASSAQSIARLALLDQAKAKLNMFSANAQGDAARRNAQMLRDKIDNDREILMAELRMNAGKLAARRAVKAKVPAGRPWMKEKDVDRWNPALGGIVRGDAAIAKGIAGKIAANNAMAGGMALVHRYMDNPNGYVFGTEDRLAAGDLYQAIQQIKRKEVMGTAATLTERDMDHSGMLTEDATKRIMGSIAKTFRGGRLPLDALVEQNRREVLSEMAHLSIYPGRAAYGAGVAETGIRKGRPEGVGGYRWIATGPEMRLDSYYELVGGKLVARGDSGRRFSPPGKPTAGALVRPETITRAR